MSSSLITRSSRFVRRRLVGSNRVPQSRHRNYLFLVVDQLITRFKGVPSSEEHWASLLLDVAVASPWARVTRPSYKGVRSLLRPSLSIFRQRRYSSCHRIRIYRLTLPGTLSHDGIGIYRLSRPRTLGLDSIRIYRTRRCRRVATTSRQECQEKACEY